MPKASAPKAPWVDVWESPHTMVSPGRVIPSSGPITCTMPWRSSPRPKQVDAKGIAIVLQRLNLSPGGGIRDVHAVFGGGYIVIHGGKGQVRPTNLSSRQPQPVEGLGAGHLVYQVAVDVQEAWHCPAVHAPRGLPRFSRTTFFPWAHLSSWVWIVGLIYIFEMVSIILK